MITTIDNLVGINKQGEKKLQPIVFEYALSNMHIVKALGRPADFEYVVFLSHINIAMDAMLVWNTQHSDDKIIYLGHWNDGVKE